MVARVSPIALVNDTIGGSVLKIPVPRTGFQGLPYQALCKNRTHTLRHKDR